MLKKLLSGICALLCCMFLSPQLFAQQKTITGTVTNSKDNAPIDLATVSIKGTKVAVTTTANGSFSISVPDGKNTLVVSSIGFGSEEISIAGKSNIVVAMKETTSSLNEVVVTGYTAQRKKDITGAVSVVNIKDLKQVPAGTGEEALQGRASGVTVISSGQPGAASDIRIRGITAFGNNQPLILIDGVGGSLTNININDIESIQVLKDASASIYGVRGSNGVIVITTKKGKAGKAKVTYDAYYGSSLRGSGIIMANPQQEADAIFLADKNSGLVPGDADWGSKQFGKGATPVIPDYITPTASSEGSPAVNPSLYNKDDYQITKANKSGTNWYNEITRNAPAMSHNISVSGGSDKSSYLFGLGYLDQQGIAINSYQKRYSVRANTLFNVKDNIRIGENAYIYYKKNPRFGNQSEGSPFTTAFRESTTIPVYDIKGNFAGTKSQDFGNARNPFADVSRTANNQDNEWSVSGNIFAEVDVAKHFTARTSFGGSFSNNYYYNFNYVGYENAEGNKGVNSFSEGAGYNSSWTWTNTLNYNNTFGNHNVKVLIGTEAIKYYGRNLSGTRSDYFSENPQYWTLATGGASGQANDGGAYQGSLWSQFARLEYGYADKYLLNATVRRDQSSVFAPAARTGIFPAFSAAWRISNESFLKGVTFINDLKLRASWGKLGSAVNVDGRNPFNLYGSNAGRSYYDIRGTSFSPTAGFYNSNIGNEKTSWEEDIITNFGVDATILNSKLDFTIEYYIKKVSGLLFPDNIDIIYGEATPPKINIGDMQNKGIDVSTTYHGAVGKDFKFDVGGTITSYNNKIIKMAKDQKYFDGPTVRNVVIQRNEIGHPVWSFYGYDVLGIFQTADEVSKAPTQKDAAPGLFRYKDINKDGKINEDDRGYIGNPNPDFTYGINLAFSYKNFDFSTFFFGSHGNDIFNQTKYFTDFPDFFKGGISREAATNSWTPTNLNATVPKLQNKGGFSSDGVTNSYFVSSGSYLRNKQMQIGYILPTRLISKIGLDRVRVYIQAANLFTITKYKGLDPELQSNDINNTQGFSVDQGNYPHPKAFLFGINLNF
jgi:TonB-dependent starch-binding outer membrane protein SusC